MIELEKEYLFWNPFFPRLHNQHVQVVEYFPEDKELGGAFNAIFPNGEKISVSGVELKELKEE